MNNRFQWGAAGLLAGGWIVQACDWAVQAHRVPILVAFLSAPLVVLTVAAPVVGLVAAFRWLASGCSR